MPQTIVSPGVWLSEHAAIQIKDRSIKIEWLLAALDHPEFVRDDLRNPGATLAFARVVQSGNRWLRVVYARRPKGVVVVTAMFDRKAEKWR